VWQKRKRYITVIENRKKRQVVDPVNICFYHTPHPCLMVVNCQNSVIICLDSMKGREVGKVVARTGQRYL
jgi:Ulp1 family protease